MGDPDRLRLAVNRMHRFFVPPDCIGSDRVVLPDEVARQVSRVLRLRAGDKVVVLDDTGWEYHLTLDEVRPDQAGGKVTDKVLGTQEPETKITLYQGVLKSGKFELVLQKCTELGVAGFVPVMCERSVPRTRADASGDKRAARWRKIVAEAAEQSGRARLPTIGDQVAFEDACISLQGPAFVPWEEETRTGLKEALSALPPTTDTSLSVMIGPEGGLTADEIGQARSSGAVPVSLGSRILRAETAAVAAVSAVLYERGDLGG